MMRGLYEPLVRTLSGMNRHMFSVSSRISYLVVLPPDYWTLVRGCC